MMDDRWRTWIVRLLSRSTVARRRRARGAAASPALSRLWIERLEERFALSGLGVDSGDERLDITIDFRDPIDFNFKDAGRLFDQLSTDRDHPIFDRLKELFPDGLPTDGYSTEVDWGTYFPEFETYPAEPGDGGYVPGFGGDLGTMVEPGDRSTSSPVLPPLGNVSLPPEVIWPTPWEPETTLDSPSTAATFNDRDGSSSFKSAVAILLPQLWNTAPDGELDGGFTPVTTVPMDEVQQVEPRWEPADLTEQPAPIVPATLILPADEATPSENLRVEGTTGVSQAFEISMSPVKMLDGTPSAMYPFEMPPAPPPSLPLELPTTDASAPADLPAQLDPQMEPALEGELPFEVGRGDLLHGEELLAAVPFTDPVELVTRDAAIDEHAESAAPASAHSVPQLPPESDTGGCRTLPLGMAAVIAVALQFFRRKRDPRLE